MARRVLVPLDRTEKGEGALEALSDLCQAGDEVVLLSVAEPRQALQRGTRPGRVIGGAFAGPSGGQANYSRPDYPTYAETGDQVVQSQLDELEDYLASKKAALTQKGFQVEITAEISDDPADAIVDIARRVSPTFILMVRTTHPGIRERLFGTVAQQVIRENVAPVMILPD